MPATTGLRAYRVAPSGRAVGGLVLVPGLRGVTESVQAFARRLGEQGYLVYAPMLTERLPFSGDLVDRVEAALADPELPVDAEVESALEHVNGFEHQRRLIRDLRSVIDAVVADPAAPANGRVGAVGWRLGGRDVFALAGVDRRVKIALAYDAPAPDLDLVETIDGTAISFYGADAPTARNAIPELRAALRRAGVPFCMKGYPGPAVAPSEPDARASTIAGDVWQRSLALLTVHLA